MNYKLLLIFTFIALFSCKNEKKLKKQNANTKQLKTNEFEMSLLDLRDVNLEFSPKYKLEKFGVLKHNDSLYSYVFRLNDKTTNQEVLNHSIGIKAYSYELPQNVEFINKGFSPVIQNKEGNKYLILKQKFLNINYIDSLEAFIFARKNYKATGKLGTIKIYDILLEEVEK